MKRKKLGRPRVWEIPKGPKPKKRPGRPRIYLKPKGRPKMSAGERKVHKFLNYKEIHQLKMRVGRDQRKFKVGALDVIAEEFRISTRTLYRIVNGDSRWTDRSNMPLGRESRFKSNVQLFLKDLSKSWYYKNDHKALRGIPDITMCLNSIFISMELKASYDKVLDKSNKSTWLQLFKLIEIEKAGGIALIVYPENFYDVKMLLINLARSKERDTTDIQRYSRHQLRRWSGKAKELLGFSPKTGLKNSSLPKKTTGV